MAQRDTLELNQMPGFVPDAPAESYKYADPKAFVAATKGDREAVAYLKGDVQISAYVYRPAGNGPFPAVVLIGPETFVKEQAPAQYGVRLAGRGYLAIAFDPAGRGESHGAPRDIESPMGKVADVRAALDYLVTRDDVDPTRLLAVAICQGSSEMLRAVADDRRIKALATLAGHYRDREGDIEWMGGEEQLAARLEKAQAAKAAFETSGEVEYVKGVDKTDGAAGMPGELVWGWYQPWADAGLWPNRFAVMSDAELLSFESMTASARIVVPYLMFHSNDAMLPDAARRHFDLVPSSNKLAHWWGDILHFQFYDDPRVIDPAVARIDEWFRSFVISPDAPSHGSLRMPSQPLVRP